jgi:hypothetical protein
VRDEDVTLVASMDEIQGRIELDKLGDHLKLKYIHFWTALNKSNTVLFKV